MLSMYILHCIIACVAMDGANRRLAQERGRVHDVPPVGEPADHTAVLGERAEPHHGTARCTTSTATMAYVDAVNHPRVPVDHRETRPSSSSPSSRCICKIYLFSSKIGVLGVWREIIRKINLGKLPDTHYLYPNYSDSDLINRTQGT